MDRKQKSEDDEEDKPKTAREKKMSRTPVYLNIYDMDGEFAYVVILKYWLNGYASNVGVGVFHSGIEIYGIEYAYGGHPLPFSGIFDNTPRDANELGENFKFRESILIGETDFSSDEVKRMVALLGEDYRGDRYHLISKNCNHFSSAFSKTLTGNDIPPWVNRLASISGSIPFLERWIPAEWLTPIALQHSLDEKSMMAAKGNEPVIPQNGAYAGATTSANGMTGGTSAASWKWFQRRASSISSVGGLPSTDTHSMPNTARSTTSATQAASASNQSLTRLWNSIKGLTSTSLSTTASSPSTFTPRTTTSATTSGPGGGSGAPSRQDTSKNSEERRLAQSARRDSPPLDDSFAPASH